MTRQGMAAGVVAMVLGLCVVAGCSGSGTTSTTVASTVTTGSAASTVPGGEVTGTTATTATSTAPSTGGGSDSQGWTTVLELKGSGTGENTSETFTLSGAPARLTWKIDTDTMWVIAAFVEPEGHDIQSQGAFPVFMESEEKEGSETLEREPGTYFLYVTVANSDWSVSVQEQK